MIKGKPDLLAVHKCIHCNWRTRRLLQIMLSNGIIVSFILSAYSGDVEKIFIDKTLVGKILSDIITDVIFTDTFAVLSYSDKAKLDYVNFTKPMPVGDAIKKFDKLSAFDPKITQLDLPGPQTTRRLDRHLSCNASQDTLLSWWAISSEEAWPWSPMTSDRERANLVVIGVNGPKLDVLSYMRTEGDPINITFSRLNSHQILTLEQALASSGERRVDVCTYEATKNKLMKTAPTPILLKNAVLCHGRNPAEDKLILGCDDGSLVLYDENRRTTAVTQTSLTPHIISWHPDGTIVMVASSKGDIQLFDMALGPLTVQITSEKVNPQRVLRLHQFFRSPPILSKMEWCTCEVIPSDYVADSVDSQLLCFDRGPLAMMQLVLGVHNHNRLSPAQLVNQYIKHQQLDEAVNLLSSMNWNVDSQMSFLCLSAIMTHLLRMPLTSDREVQLEATLGTFYGRQLSEVVVLEHRDHIGRLARRFFHHLLRYSRFDKAFLLAIDIGARDLFMDIHYMAKDKGETALAQVAKKKADEIEAEMPLTDTTESLTSFDEEASPDASRSLDDESFEEFFETDLDKPYNPPPLASTAKVNLQSQNQISSAEAASQLSERPYPYTNDLDADLATELYDDYTRALLGEGSSPRASGQRRGSQNEAADESSSSVKVIHFGLV
ncbi:WD repeat-containing and planar cell polarity effector protein fritz homolog isoform X2 [Lineus longissimus]|uniref:WD repeat-containing and planar cell polarity effector protein fritz homolog isoform X2 n=1 Tax=Lineus longissimus TaxID=88925 RepID=UPI00315CC330